MSTRKLKMEENSKYIPTIFDIVQKKTQEYYVKINFIQIFILK
jgi:hypothetical protein